MQVRGTNEERPISLLTVLVMVAAVGGAAAMAGAATAAIDADATITSVVEYEGDGGPAVEVVLDQRLDGGEDVVVRSGGVRAVGERYDGRTITANLTGDVSPNANLSIAVVSNGTTVDVATDVEVTATAIREGGGGDGLVYAGEPIAIVADQYDEEIVLEGEEVVVSGSAGAHSRVMTYDTGDLTAGTEYAVAFRGAGEDAETETFDVAELDLSVSAGSTSLSTGEDLAVTATANRGGASAEAALVDADGDTVETVTKELRAARETTFEFGTVAAGEYTVAVTDAETGATARTDTITVTDPGPSDVAFARSTVEDERGDLVSIPIATENTDRATVVLGSPGDGYWVHAHVTDANDDGRIVLQFNTYTAGNDYYDNDSAIPGSAVLWSENDAVSDVTQGGAYVEAGYRVGADSIDLGSYEMAVGAGHAARNGLDRTDVGTMTVSERETRNLTVHVAPASVELAELDAAAIRAGLGSNVTRADSIADDDVVVHELDATGLGGVAAFRGSTGMVLHGWVDLTIAPTERELNEGSAELDLSPSNTAVIADPANDTYYLAVDTGAVAVEDGRRYNSTVDPVGTLATGPVVADEWSKVATEATIETTADGLVAVQSIPNQTVEASTNLAPGTTVTARIRSTDAASPFLVTPTATVGSNGAVTARTDEFTDVPYGTNFTVALRHDGGTLATADGRVLRASEETPAPNGTATATATADPAPAPNATATPESTPTAAPTTTSAAGPGFGVALAVLAVLATALLAARRNG